MIEPNAQKTYLCRLAKQQDAPALFALNEEFNGDGSNTVQAIAASLQYNANETVFVAECNGEIVGFCCGQIFRSLCYGVNYAEITELYVVESHRKRGIAKGLLSSMEDFYKEIGIENLQLFTGHDNLAAQALYASVGYGASDEVLYRKRPKQALTIE